MQHDSSPPSSTAGYAAEADRLAVQYESFSFADVHRDVAHLFPAAPARVLDIGAGTGRDAAGFAALGHSVTAAEPTAELRAHGMRLHKDAAIAWADDSLPELARLRAAPARFDLIMLTAVWMHLDPGERARAMPALADLLAPVGLTILSLRHGPVPVGRRMFDVSGDETVALARAHGLELAHRGPRADTQRRSGIDWTVLALRRPA
jgi:SAM-dependent methyltransferase